MAVSSVKCEVRVIGAKNVETTSKGAIFIRCYISAGYNRNIQLNTREIMSSDKDQSDHIIWDETFSLECNGEQDAICNLKEENIIFEMRRKKMGGSQLVGRAEVPWKSVFDATNMEILKWVSMTRNEKVENEECWINPVALQVGIKVELPDMSRSDTKRRRRNERMKNRDGCECSSSSNGGCCSCVDTHLLLSAEAFDAF
ncbi:uncharacterized protein LOC141617212 [Silene latifolia]|uniref:uncharacterized protein LOC141617212 n=1 Tax=Silene latifolia TaxID=37657 RepID=UPI003D77F440